MFTGSCFWKMQAFMQSLQMRWPVPGSIGLSMQTIASAATESPELPHVVHLADALVERAPVELDAERVLLDLARLGILDSLGARVLVAVVAVEAVVDLALDLALVHAPVGELEALARAALVLGADEELGELGIAAVELHELLEIQLARLAEGRPQVRRIVVVPGAGRQPARHRRQRRLGHGPGALVGRLRVLREAQRGGGDGAPRLVAGEGRRHRGRQLPQLRAPDGAAGLGDLARGVLDLQEPQRRPRHRRLLGLGARPQQRPVGPRRRQRQPRRRRQRRPLARVRLRHPLLHEVALEGPHRVVIQERPPERRHLVLDAEELRHEGRQVRRRRDEGLAGRRRRRQLAPPPGQRVEAVGGLLVVLPQGSVEEPGQLRQPRGLVQIRVGEPIDPQRELFGGRGGIHPGAEVTLRGGRGVGVVGEQGGCHEERSSVRVVTNLQGAKAPPRQEENARRRVTRAPHSS
jgi:hypothetical protein